MVEGDSNVLLCVNFTIKYRYFQFKVLIWVYMVLTVVLGGANGAIMAYALGVLLDTL